MKIEAGDGEVVIRLNLTEAWEIEEALRARGDAYVTPRKLRGLLHQRRHDAQRKRDQSREQS